MKKIFRFLSHSTKRFENQLYIWNGMIKYSIAAKKHLKAAPATPLSQSEKKSIKSFYGRYGLSNINTDWHRFHKGIQGRFDVRYIPSTTFYSKLERTLNRKDFICLQDKNLLEVLFSNLKQPVNIVKNMNGFYYLGQALVKKDDAIKALMEYPSFIIKPTIESGGGKNIQVISKPFNEGDCIDLFDQYGKDFIIQELLEQSPIMSQLNPSSVNTLRITTYLNEEGVHVCTSHVRIGGKSSKTDNVTSGGIACSINTNGILDDLGYDKDLKPKGHSEYGTPLKGFKIPEYGRVIAFVKQAHNKVPYFKFISWDICIDKEEQPVLIEFNVWGQGIIGQGHNGPLFREHTEEILNLVNPN